MGVRRCPIPVICLAIIVGLVLGFLLPYALISRRKPAVPWLNQSFRLKTHEDFTWKKILPDFYVYSVYPIVNVPEVHFIVIAPTQATSLRNRVSGNGLECRCTFYSWSGSSNISVKGTLQILPETHELDEKNNLSAGRVICSFTEEAAHRTSLELNCRYREHLGSATFHTPSLRNHPPKKLSFALCGLIHGFANGQPASVTEFVEYYRLMGVSKIFWFGIDIRNRTRKLLTFYEDEGVMEFREWINPVVDSDRIHYCGQVAAQYDCILRTAGLYDYTVVADLDEFYGTTKLLVGQPSFLSMVDYGATDCVIIRSAFMDPYADYSTDRFDPSTGMPVLRTASITKRSAYIWPPDERSKYVCRMRKVNVPMIHTVESYRGSVIVDRPSPEETLLLHYRKPKEMHSSVSEVRGAATAKYLQPRVNAVWREVFG